MDTSDFVLPVDDNFLCTICQCVMLNPTACSEGHQFCRDCISKWLQQSPTCPQRCGDLAVGSLMKLRAVENLINNLQVRCCHAGVADGPSPGSKNLRHRSRANLASGEAGSDEGCGWEGALEEREGHLRDECAYAELDCSFEGCNATALRSQLAEHEASCECREVCCDKLECKEKAKAGEMNDHLMECMMVEIDCPQECGARVLRRDVGEHEKECANVVVRCSFAEHGCEVLGKRKKVVEHEEEAAMAHARLAARRAGRERERNAEVEEQLSAKTKMLAEQALQFQQALAEKTNEFEHRLGQKTETLTQKTKEFQDQVKQLEKELEKSNRQLASALQVAGRKYGETRVNWEIKDFTAKALGKKDLKSKTFQVQTKAGVYSLRLSLRFYRRHRSTKRGVVGLILDADSELWEITDSGIRKIKICRAVNLGGTKLTVQAGETKHNLRFLKDDDAPYESESWLSTDNIHGLK